MSHELHPVRFKSCHSEEFLGPGNLLFACITAKYRNQQIPHRERDSERC